MQTFLIYGANGYTGELIAREAARRGWQPVLAGRNGAQVAALAQELQLPHQVFALDDAARLDEALRPVAAVLHCAGPFAHTAAPMAEACLRAGTHYLDITGEISVFEDLARRNAAARAARVLLLPGVGFDVVPSDCLARHLANRLPTATHLTLAFHGLGAGGASHGTQATMLLNAGSGGAVRRAGRIVPVPAAWKTRRFDFGHAQRTAVTIPWGDVSTAFHSTGIPNIEVYMALPKSARRMLRLSRYLGPLLAARPVQALLKRRIAPGGPTAEQRQRGRMALYGEASDDAGQRVAARLIGPEGYAFTVLTALHITEKVLRGEAPVGFQTPAKAFGAGLVLEVEGVELVDL